MNSSSHCVIVPSFNSGRLLEPTILAVLDHWQPVYLVIDGSTDGSVEVASRLASGNPKLKVVRRQNNGGKGAAVLDGMHAAARDGFSYAAVFDSDGQHDAGDLPKFMAASQANPESLVLGAPRFGADAPRIRVYGRRVGNFFSNLETFGGGIADSLFGLRVYPINPSIGILTKIKGGRGFDFDTQMVVRLFWAGFSPLNIPTQVYYKQPYGGVSHFRYFKDNLLLIRTHAQLLACSIIMFPKFLCFPKHKSLASA